MDPPNRVYARTVPRAFVERAFMGLTAIGVDLNPIFARLSMDPTQLDDRIPLSEMYRFWDAAVAVTGRHDLGVQLALQIRPEMYEVFGYVISRSETLGDALLRASRYIRLISDGMELSLKVEGDRAFVTHHRQHGDLAHPQSTEFITGAIGIIGRQITGKHLVPIEVHFSHAAPPDPTPQEQLFEGPVLYSRPDDGYVFSADLMHLPVLSRDSTLLALLERQAQQILESLPKTGEFSRRVREVLAGELRGGNPGLESVAEKLAIHPKTLGRRLREEGTSHQKLLDALRRDLAERHLRETELSVSEIAFLLGYSDASAFNKAFHRWTGAGPTAFRSAAR